MIWYPRASRPAVATASQAATACFPATSTSAITSTPVTSVIANAGSRPSTCRVEIPGDSCKSIQTSSPRIATGARYLGAGRAPMTRPCTASSSPSVAPTRSAPMPGSTMLHSVVPAGRYSASGRSRTSCSDVDIEPVRPSAVNSADTASLGASASSSANPKASSACASSVPPSSSASPRSVSAIRARSAASMVWASVTRSRQSEQPRRHDLLLNLAGAPVDGGRSRVRPLAPPRPAARGVTGFHVAAQQIARRIEHGLVGGGDHDLVHPGFGARQITPGDALLRALRRGTKGPQQLIGFAERRHGRSVACGAQQQAKMVGKPGAALPEDRAAFTGQNELGDPPAGVELTEQTLRGDLDVDKRRRAEFVDAG